MSKQIINCRQISEGKYFVRKRWNLILLHYCLTNFALLILYREYRDTKADVDFNLQRLHLPLSVLNCAKNKQHFSSFRPLIYYWTSLWAQSLFWDMFSCTKWTRCSTMAVMSACLCRFNCLIERTAFLRDHHDYAVLSNATAKPQWRKKQRCKSEGAFSLQQSLVSSANQGLDGALWNINEGKYVRGHTDLVKGKRKKWIERERERAQCTHLFHWNLRLWLPMTASVKGSPDQQLNHSG